MSLPKAQERRSQVRYSIVGQIPVTIFSTEGETIAYHAVDASTSGFGIVISQNLAKGTQLFLDVADYKRVSFRVIWTVPEATNEDMNDEAPLFRCGLATGQKELDLIELISRRQNLILTPKD